MHQLFTGDVPCVLLTHCFAQVTFLICFLMTAMEILNMRVLHRKVLYFQEGFGFGWCISRRSSRKPVSPILSISQAEDFAEDSKHTISSSSWPWPTYADISRSVFDWCPRWWESLLGLVLSYWNQLGQKWSHCWGRFQSWRRWVHGMFVANPCSQIRHMDIRSQFGRVLFFCKITGLQHKFNNPSYQVCST